jgi:hypothetical protein
MWGIWVSKDSEFYADSKNINFFYSSYIYRYSILKYCIIFTKVPEVLLYRYAKAMFSGPANSIWGGPEKGT